MSAAEITTLYNSGGGLDASSNSGNYISASNLVGYWKMDENSGTSLTDSSRNSNTATMINMSDADWIQGNASFSKSSASSSDNKTFTLDPSAFLSASTTYKTRVTTGVKDAAGNNISSQYETPNGFTTSSIFLMGGGIQGSEMSSNTRMVTTFAGSSSGSTDATGTSASFNSPDGITTDGTNLYVADFDNHRIRKIVISTGAVTTIAGSSQGSTDATGTSARFYNPTEITTDGTSLYVADTDNHRIRKID